jgi:predicted PurR-regulated permease PerM
MSYVPMAVLAVLILYLFYVVGSVAIIPVLASFALAYMLNPLVRQIERSGLSRTVSVVFAITIVSVVASAFLLFVIPDLWARGAAAGEKIMPYFSPENAAEQRAVLRRYSPFIDRVAGDEIEHLLADPREALGSPASWMFGGLSGFVETAVASLDLLLVPFFAFYILMDFRRWRTSLEDLIPPRFRDTFSRLFDEMGRILEAYVRGQVLIGCVMALLYAVGFAALGVPAWAGIAAVAGLLNAVPYIGTAIGIILATLFTFLDGGEFWRVASVIGVFALVQSIEGYYLTPRILGTRLSLHPMAVILGLLIGGKLYGLLGVILAIPTIAVSKVFLMFFRELYKGSRYYHNGDISPEEAPSEVLEVRLAEAAEVVLQDQTDAQTGDELLAPDLQDDDPARVESVVISSQ